MSAILAQMTPHFERVLLQEPDNILWKFEINLMRHYRSIATLKKRLTSQLSAILNLMTLGFNRVLQITFSNKFWKFYVNPWRLSGVMVMTNLQNPYMSIFQHTAIMFPVWNMSFDHHHSPYLNHLDWKHGQTIDIHGRPRLRIGHLGWISMVNQGL